MNRIPKDVPPAQARTIEHKNPITHRGIPFGRIRTTFAMSLRLGDKQLLSANALLFSHGKGEIYFAMDGLAPRLIQEGTTVVGRAPDITADHSPIIPTRTDESICISRNHLIIELRNGNLTLREPSSGTTYGTAITNIKPDWAQNVLAPTPRTATPVAISPPRTTSDAVETGAMKILAGGATGEIGWPQTAAIANIGTKKRVMQDSVALKQLGGITLMLVADGMTKMGAGEEASAAAVDGALGCDLATSDARALIRAADQAVKACREATFAATSASTTFVAARIEGDKADISHAGDSRALLFRNGRLLCLTSDGAPGKLYWAEKNSLAETFPHSDPNLSKKYYEGVASVRSMGVTSLGDGKEQNWETNTKVKLQPKDVLVLCSDGLHNFATYEQVQQTIAQNVNRPPLEIAQALEQLALAGMTNHGDNIGIAVHVH